MRMTNNIIYRDFYFYVFLKIKFNDKNEFNEFFKYMSQNRIKKNYLPF